MKNKTSMKKSSRTAVPFTRVSLTDGFWAPRQTINREVTLPVEYKQCKETGRLDAFKLDWKPGMPNQPHRFWDSDIGKWIEAAAYRTAPAARRTVAITAVPYCVWGNRAPGEEMLVWLNRSL